MAVEIEVENITPYFEKWEPQVFLSRKYKSQPALPIRGGWGYSETDAVVIDKSHPAAANFRPFNGVEVEHLFARLRMYEELIGCRPEGKQHAGTQIKLKKQGLRSGENGKKYDVMEFDITALPLEVWEALKAEWQGPDGFHEDGVLTYPIGYQQGRQYPLVLVIHGGPASGSGSQSRPRRLNGPAGPLPQLSSSASQ